MILLALAAWRYAFFITNDSLPEPIKFRLLDKMVDPAHPELSEKLEELIGNEEHPGCIYCMTFWTSLVLLVLSKGLKSNFIVQLGAIWAIATLIGVSHNVIVSYMSDDENENDEVE